ncbi:hypothetical protein HELRODRAFT_162305 [Helobdella robusta]|uniref:Uncharacterized protein n=1 Tax=Helobdella robusta TaxID=6412 RepID=T1ESH4_HELRO|nr:hypothetical protein HELRODRAFT_162305 [Helobdella robusta]ESN98845.1 hypothetical protein HELRODRAFT_162305 [Helobdella robusta]
MKFQTLASNLQLNAPEVTWEVEGGDELVTDPLVSKWKQLNANAKLIWKKITSAKRIGKVVLSAKHIYNRKAWKSRKLHTAHRQTVERTHANFPQLTEQAGCRVCGEEGLKARDVISSEASQKIMKRSFVWKITLKYYP